jgi:CheY-like chemotaxis protein
MSTRPLLALGSFSGASRQELEGIAAQSDHQLVVARDVTEAKAFLEQTHPQAVVVDVQQQGTEVFCLNLRAQTSHALTPIVALVDEVTDLAFAGAFSWGGDDVVGSDKKQALVGRLRRLPHEIAVPDSGRRGLAVVADPDRDRRLVRARVLRNAGYQVQFAVSAEDLQRAHGDGPVLVVVDEELEGGLRVLSRAANDTTNTLYLAAPRRIGTLSAELQHNARTLVADGFAPPENIVFLANELSRGGTSDKRASKRLLYGTRVVFRGEGREEEDYGYSYNISEGGLYVRTLAVPDDDRVWLEMRPPRSDRLVRLEGEVVWRRPFGPLGFATVPPGFGVRIIDATASNRGAWEAGYAAFATALGVAA